VGSNPLLIGEAQQVEYLNLIGGDLMELRFDPRTFGSDTMFFFLHVHTRVGEERFELVTSAL
jgi:hypothetical protein